MVLTCSDINGYLLCRGSKDGRDCTMFCWLSGDPRNHPTAVVLNMGVLDPWEEYQMILSWGGGCHISDTYIIILTVLKNSTKVTATQ